VSEIESEVAANIFTMRTQSKRERGEREERERERERERGRTDLTLFRERIRL
jgi:hypothetical protein